MALLTFYAGLVLGVAAGMTIMALLVFARTRERPPPPPALEDWGPPPREPKP
jgi:hypothetical protein